MSKSIKEPPRFTNLYVFGDGFSNAENTTNELTWVDYLSDYLWLSLRSPSTAQPSDGINFALNGATLETLNQQQIPAFTGSIKKRQKADPDALYILAAGAVDYAANHSPLHTDPAAPMQHLEAAVLALVKVGAKHIMVMNVPDVAPAHSSVKAAIAAHNQALEALLLRLAPKTHLIAFDVRSVMAEIIRDARHLGFKNTTDVCLASGNPNEFVFWDEMHPTSKVHQLIARAALEVLCQSTSLRLVMSCAL